MDPIVRIILFNILRVVNGLPPLTKKEIESAYSEAK